MAGVHHLSRRQAQAAPAVSRRYLRAIAREKAAHYAERAKNIGLASATPKRHKPDSQQTCESWIQRWHDDRVARGLTSAKDSLAHGRTHIVAVLGAKHPKDWTKDDFRSLSAALDVKVQSGAANWKTAANVWGTVTKMADDACNAKLPTIRCREDNPAEGVRGPDRGTKTQRQYLYPSEFERFVGCENVPLEWRQLVVVSIYTYCRAGELRALTWDDVDFERGILSVTKSVERETGAVKCTKTKAPRLVPLEAALVPLLRQMRCDAGGEGHILELPTGRHLSRDFKNWLRKSGVERRSLFTAGPSVKPLRFHDLRSTGITWMAVRGDDPLRIQQRAGHTDFNTTQGYIRESEILRDGFGEPFPVLPGGLIRSRGERFAVPECTKGQLSCAGLSSVVVEAPGAEVDECTQ